MEYIKKADAISWGVLGGIILMTYLFFSDGEFSLIFTLAGTVQTFGFALIVIKIRKSRSVSGLSRETFICYALIFTIRSVIFIFFKVRALPLRATSHSTAQETLSSNCRKSSLLASATTSCTPSGAPTRPVTTRTSTPSRATT